MMGYERMRGELTAYYLGEADGRAADFCRECEQVMDAAFFEGMSAREMKRLQYRVISERFTPVLFPHSPFYYEMGTMSAQCDGAGEFRYGHTHAGGWTYRKNRHKYMDRDEKLWELSARQRSEKFYLICGPYHDARQHFIIHYRPVLREGLRGICERAQRELLRTECEREREYLETVIEGLLAVKRIAEKFAKAASEAIPCAKDKETERQMRRIAETAARVPWERPETFYEALNTYALLRKALGSLEGVGFNSFGRLDLDLAPYYDRDIREGRLTEEEAEELIARFLITFDCHYDHDMKMVGYADHELENTYVLGGCDASGAPFYHPLTRLFLKITREERIIYPKIKCRFSAASPREYLDEIDRAVIAGTSTVLYQNDDATIPALLHAGRTLSEARDYVVSGCWDLSCQGVEKIDGGNYINILKPFEYSLHRLTDKMEAVGLSFPLIEDGDGFEELYQKTLTGIATLVRERFRVGREGFSVAPEVDPLPLFSCLMDGAIERRRDFTEGCTRYRDEAVMCFGFPNLVDSLLAIRELCFSRPRYALSELLTAVRANWEGYREMREAALRCHGWGDGSDASCEMGARLHRDLYAIFSAVRGTYGGRVALGYLTYTEVRFWGDRAMTTPDGRRSGDYVAQGLTPLRLKRIASVGDVIRSTAALDKTLTGGNSVVNVILSPAGMTLDRAEGFLRAVAASGIQSLQLNCTTKEQLLDAQKHPEKYPDLVVRVTGFSAKFTSLSPEWQEEVITRNFYDR